MIPSEMVNIYTILVKNEKKKLEEVPESIRSLVEAKLNENADVQNEAENS